jgi:hypothetical protein
LKYNPRIVLAFIAKLGNVAEWDYEGECFDLGPRGGKCVCGHFIRYAYIIHHKGDNKTEQIGSTCIDFFKEYSPELYASLALTRKQRRSAAVKASRAKKQGINIKLETLTEDPSQLHFQLITA